MIIILSLVAIGFLIYSDPGVGLFDQNVDNIFMMYQVINQKKVFDFDKIGCKYDINTCNWNTNQNFSLIYKMNRLDDIVM